MSEHEVLVATPGLGELNANRFYARQVLRDLHEHDEGGTVLALDVEGWCSPDAEAHEAAMLSLEQRLDEGAELLCYLDRGLDESMLRLVLRVHAAGRTVRFHTLDAVTTDLVVRLRQRFDEKWPEQFLLATLGWADGGKEYYFSDAAQGRVAV